MSIEGNHHYFGPPLSPNSIGTAFVFDIETNRVIPLVDNANATCYTPKWSPVGGKLLVYCNLSDTETIDAHVYLFGVPENDPIHFSKIADLACTDFSWSPAGERFIARCQADSGWTWAVFKANGSKEREISSLGTKEELIIGQVVWSPDGQQILYTAGPDRDDLQIYIMDTDGSNSHVITTRPSNYSQLSVYSLAP